MTDTISDMLARIRNGGRALLPEVEVPHSKVKENLAHILKKEGYVKDVAVEGEATRKRIKVTLKYNGKKSAIEGIRRVSTPGMRRYVGATEVPRVHGGMGIAVLSTSNGVMTGAEARKNNVGGELMCYVW